MLCTSSDRCQALEGGAVKTQRTLPQTPRITLSPSAEAGAVLFISIVTLIYLTYRLIVHINFIKT